LRGFSLVSLRSKPQLSGKLSGQTQPGDFPLPSLY
jgi:hypothetical protein